jgi:hypothetical protein
MSILTTDEITEIFCIVDDFCKNFQPEMEKLQKLPEHDRKHRDRSCEMSKSEIITILLLFHIGHFKNFKHFYLACVQVNLRKEFHKQLSYSRFIQIEHRIFVPMMFILNTVCFGKCTGITFVDSTKIAVCHNKRIRRNRVFAGLARTGKSSMGWFQGFKLHLVCNDKGELLSFVLTPANVDDRTPQMVMVLTKELFGKLIGDRGYISQSLFETLFNE